MISAGILPIGFCWRIESAASVGSAFSIVISLSRPRIAAASFTLRPNGEGGEERRIIMGQRVRDGAGIAPGRRQDSAERRQDGAGEKTGVCRAVRGFPTP